MQADEETTTFLDDGKETNINIIEGKQQRNANIYQRPQPHLPILLLWLQDLRLCANLTVFKQTSYIGKYIS